MEKYLGLLPILFLAFILPLFWQNSAVLGESAEVALSNTIPAQQPVTTQSSFIQKLEEFSEIIPRKIITTDDPEMETGEEEVLEEGGDGKRIKIVKITYTKDGKEFEREIVSEETTDPKDKKVLKGTKIVWRTVQTPDGEIRYWRKMRVYATHYDKFCKGCNEWTAIGLRAGKGVIAVDPKVIKLRSKVYIPGYGLAVAGDTGGAIKGNIIDLGFEDAKTAGWSARFVDIYLL